MINIDQLIPEDIMDALFGANAPTAANPFVTIADLSGSSIYSGSGSLTAGATTVTGISTDVLTFSGSTTKMSYTALGKTITSGVGTNPIGFLTPIGDLNYLQLGTSFDAFGGLFEGGNGEPVFQSQIYDNSTFIEQACVFAGIDNFSGTDRPYYSMYYSNPAGVEIGFQSDINGEQLYTQRLGLAATALTGTEGIIFVNATGYLKAATIADLATFVVDGNGIYDGSGSLSVSATVSMGANILTFDQTAGGIVLFNDTNGNVLIDNGTIRATDTSSTDSITINGDIGITKQGGSIGEGSVTIEFPVPNSLVNYTSTLQEGNGTLAFLSDITTSGDGIYDGNGIVPAATIVTLTDAILFDGVNSYTIQSDVSAAATSPFIIERSNGSNIFLIGTGGIGDGFSNIYNRNGSLRIQFHSNSPSFINNSQGLSVGSPSIINSLFEVAGDVEVKGNNMNGFIVLDRTNGLRYKIYTDGGAIQVESA